MAGDDQQLENGCVTRGPPRQHAQALHVPQHAVDENFAAAQDVVLVQVVGVVGVVVVGQQLLKSDGEYWETEMAKNAHC